ncbi:MAG: hypothetical protein GY910_15215 [bacterium]|nr:hypothetical protein [bacterium]
MSRDDTLDVAEGNASGQEDSIAIVGIGYRYADARDPEEFWEIVRSGCNTVRDAPEHRIELGTDIDHVYDSRSRIPGKISSRKGDFLEDPELFDPAPFGIAPRDVPTLEPRQRLLVEMIWDVLEDAGIVSEEIAGKRVAVILCYMVEGYCRERAGVLGEEAVCRGHDVPSYRHSIPSEILRSSIAWRTRLSPRESIDISSDRWIPECSERVSAGSNWLKSSGTCGERRAAGRPAIRVRGLARSSREWIGYDVPGAVFHPVSRSVRSGSAGPHPLPRRLSNRPRRPTPCRRVRAYVRGCSGS